MSNWDTIKDRIHTVIFGTHTRAGKIFDIVLLWAIVISVLVVVLESVPAIDARYHTLLRRLEWFFTIIFTLEYAGRIISLERPARYMFSFFGIVDFLAILPTWLSLFAIQSQFLIAIRLMRLLRIFRIFKLVRHVQGMRQLQLALRNSIPKITVFFIFVLSLVTILGTFMYMIEGKNSGFTSIPQSIYWAIVTLTTVGYGDITPITTLGKFMASIIMILGYSILAVPTGIVSSEMTSLKSREVHERICEGCGWADHEPDAGFCKKCGAKIPLLV